MVMDGAAVGGAASLPLRGSRIELAGIALQRPAGRDVEDSATVVFPMERAAEEQDHAAIG